MLMRWRVSHTPSRFFFRQQGSVHLACCPVFISSFCPEALLLGNLRGSVHPTHCLFIFLFFIDGGGTCPHSGSFPPQKGGFFFFSVAVSSTGVVYDLPTLLPSLLGVFFLQLRYRRGGSVQPTRCSLLSCLPLRNGGIFFCFAIVKHTEAVYYAHAAPRLSYPLLCT